MTGKNKEIIDAAQELIRAQNTLMTLRRANKSGTRTDGERVKRANAALDKARRK